MKSFHHQHLLHLIYTRCSQPVEVDSAGEVLVVEVSRVYTRLLVLTHESDDFSSEYIVHFELNLTSFCPRYRLARRSLCSRDASGGSDLKKSIIAGVVSLSAQLFSMTYADWLSGCLVMVGLVDDVPVTVVRVASNYQYSMVHVVVIVLSTDSDEQSCRSLLQLPRLPGCSFCRQRS